MCLSAGRHGICALRLASDLALISAFSLPGPDLRGVKIVVTYAVAAVLFPISKAAGVVTDWDETT
jgi:hypothetical protein